MAHTQFLKNKDIPFSGSKGTILMREDKNHMEKFAMLEYVDSMCNIMNNDEGVKHSEPYSEIVFLGPDENTADKMDSSCN